MTSQVHLTISFSSIDTLRELMLFYPTFIQFSILMISIFMYLHILIKITELSVTKYYFIVFIVALKILYLAK
jgi:hypothetical protein